MNATSNAELARLSIDIKKLDAKPLWERTTSLGPGTPAIPAIWRYRDMRPQLLRAAELITAKDAERRVFMLENPGLPGSDYTTNTLQCGLQVIMPGEIAPAHRHTPNALRFIIEGEGAYTTVEGERIQLHPGDLVLTPGWTWHDHGHLGTAPAVWIDVLDNAFARFFGAMFRENYPGDTHPVEHPEGQAAARYGANMMPVDVRLNHRASPRLVYPYDRTRAALDRLARSGTLHPAHGVKMRYVSPANGGYVFPTIATFIQWLPEGFSGQTYRSTDGTMFHAVEGSGCCYVGKADFAFETHDVFAVPPWTPYRFETESECVLFSCSDRAAQESLGFWREEDPSNSAEAGRSSP
jgi:gentisate 1,2-dioxygenase